MNAHFFVNPVANRVEFSALVGRLLFNGEIVLLFLAELGNW